MDVDRDEYLLNRLNIPSSSIATYRICCNFLKICACEYGLVLRDIANMMVRFPELPYNDKFGPLESQENETYFITEDGEDLSTLEKLLKLATETPEVAKQQDSDVGLTSFLPRSPNASNGLTRSDSSEFSALQLDRFMTLLKSYLNEMCRANGFNLPPVKTTVSDNTESLPPPPPPVVSSPPKLWPKGGSDGGPTIFHVDMGRQLEGQTLQKISAIN